MKRIDRLRRQHRGNWQAGERIANRLHVSASSLAVCRACWQAIDPVTRRHGFARGLMRDALHALFRGALAAHRENRALFTHYRF